MSFFEDASLVLIPSAQKTSKVYSVKPTDGTGDLTFTRSNDTASRVGPDGLIEKVRTNVLTYSNTFSDAAWSKQQVGTGITPVVTANYTTDPFGGNNAWRLQCDLNGGTTSGDRSWIYNSFGALSQSTVSIYVKLNTAGTKNVVFSDSGGDVTTLTSTEWVRISITVTGAGGEFRFGLIGGASDTLDCSIAFAQAETGDIATEPILTTSAAVSVGPVANVPRLDYLGSSCPRLLLEPQRTNLLTYSEQFDNAIWAKGGVSVTANQAVSPDGYTNADLATTTNVGHFLFNSGVVTPSSVYTFSFYVKRGTMTDMNYRVYNDTAGTDIIPPTSYYSQTSNDWTRITLTFTAPAGCTLVRAYVLSDSGVTGTAFFYGAQLEAGAYATSYIPTLGAAVTRGADAASKTGISSLIGSTEGTLFADIQATDTGYWYISLSNGTNQNWVFVGQDETTGSKLRAFLRSGAVTYADIFSSVITNGRYKMAIAYKANDVVFYVNGVQIGADTSATMPTGLANLYVSSSNASGGDQTMTGAVNQTLLFKTRLSNSDLAALTA
jgi:hypothetical protein